MGWKSECALIIDRQALTTAKREIISRKGADKCRGVPRMLDARTLQQHSVANKVKAEDIGVTVSGHLGGYLDSFCTDDHDNSVASELARSEPSRRNLGYRAQKL